ncbi:MAG TPA: hypothetical protein VHY18_09730 [Solirubrobacteraceae bacterium]|jgi:hypothetical protein|nr:hypothetical protein [Solirubrobacteraceae bacterium]
MPDHRIQQAQEVEDNVGDESRDGNVLGLIVDSGWPWTVDEIACELGTLLGARDSVARLSGAGLVHRFGEFVFPTRTALRAEQIGAGTA